MLAEFYANGRANWGDEARTDTRCVYPKCACCDVRRGDETEGIYWIADYSDVSNEAECEVTCRSALRISRAMRGCEVQGNIRQSCYVSVRIQIAALCRLRYRQNFPTTGRAAVTMPRTTGVTKCNTFQKLKEMYVRRSNAEPPVADILQYSMLSQLELQCSSNRRLKDLYQRAPGYFTEKIPEPRSRRREN